MEIAEGFRLQADIAHDNLRVRGEQSVKLDGFVRILALVIVIDLLPSLPKTVRAGHVRIGAKTTAIRSGRAMLWERLSVKNQPVVR